MSTPKILIIDDDDSIRWVLEKTMNRQQIATVSVASGENILALIEKHQPDAIISDIRMPGTDGLEMLELLQQSHPELPVIIMTAHSDLETAVAAFKSGAFEYLPKPFDITEAVTVINRALQQGKNKSKQDKNKTNENNTGIIGQSAAMQQLFRALGRLSRSEASVLLNGESGTGKELVAKALHSHSLRATAPFIALNMAAIPKELVESELFGHEKGAFTGANQRRIGRFEQADKGTLFLDEIGDMPLETQTRLLRVLADGEFYRVGGHISVKVDVRVIAATHQNLRKLVSDGKFREDLYHRINVIRLHLPRLAERQEDIGLLAEHFLEQAANELKVTLKFLSEDALDFLTQLQWPGNVRQLENVCRWLTVMASGDEVHRVDLPDDLTDQIEVSHSQIKQPVHTHAQDYKVTKHWQAALRQSIKHQFAQGEMDLLNKLSPEFEQILLEEALLATHGHKQKAAAKLGWGRNTLTRKLKEFYGKADKAKPPKKRN